MSMPTPSDHSPRRDLFISYDHANDEPWRQRFEPLVATTFQVSLSPSVNIGDIDPRLDAEPIRRRIREEHLRALSVTVVLVGAQTWQRRNVDWEISAGLWHAERGLRSGLVGVLLPTYPRPSWGRYDPRTLPARLHDNLSNGFATLDDWDERPDVVARWIHDASRRRAEITPDNARVLLDRDWPGPE